MRAVTYGGVVLPRTRAFLARHRASRVEVITDRLVATIEAGNPGYRRLGVVPRADLWRSCHDNVRRVLELLVEAPGKRADRDPAYDAARATGRRRAEQGMPLDDVLRSFRMGGRLIWDDLLELAAADPAGDPDDGLDPTELREVGGRLWEVVDETSAQVASAYHLHERAAVRADEQLRAELWVGVLAGRAQDAGFAHEAARILDLPADADLAVVLGGLDPATGAAALAPHGTAWVRRTDGVVGLVALRHPSTTEVVAMLEQVAGRVAVGVSAPVAGLAGVPTGVRQASLALRTQAGRPGVACFDARLPEALLLGVPDVTGRLVDRWLGAVLALPPAEAGPLLDTLHAWVESGGSAVRAADRVPCHRNTVLNRVRRVAELTGRPLAEGRPPVELDLALRAVRADATD